MALKLTTKIIEKPWGRYRIPEIFGCIGGRRIGEVWFTSSKDLPLLAKYIFTSERLSIQVHPNDEQARARRLPGGKNECWLILDAEPDATLGLGLVRRLSSDDLRAAALDGSIENLVDWRPVCAGDFFYVPAGTVHAIGPGITLLEFQQNVDVTYRLYDYGRPRELHLAEGITAARAEPYPSKLAQHVDARDNLVLVSGLDFSLVQLASKAETPAMRERQRWVMPLEGKAVSTGVEAVAGECLLLDPGEPLHHQNARLLIGMSGPPLAHC